MKILFCVFVLATVCWSQALIVPTSWGSIGQSGTFYPCGPGHTPLVGSTIAVPHLSPQVGTPPSSTGWQSALLQKHAGNTGLAAADPAYISKGVIVTHQSLIELALPPVVGPAPGLRFDLDVTNPAWATSSDGYLLVSTSAAPAGAPHINLGQPFWVDPLAQTTIAFESPAISPPISGADIRTTLMGLPLPLAGWTFYVQQVILFYGPPANFSLMTGDCYRVEWQDVATYTPPAGQQPFYYPNGVDICGWYIP